MKQEIIIQGTHCSACKALIEDIASEIPGIISCAVDFTTGKTILEYSEAADLTRLYNEIDALGPYKVVRLIV